MTEHVRMLHKRFCGEYNIESKFKASKGWFNNFDRHFDPCSLAQMGETASVDEDAAAAFLATFKKLIEEKGYKSEQVFSMDEIGLFWKRMPKRT